MVNVDNMQRFLSPVNPSIYPHLTVTLLMIGLIYTAWFLVYMVTTAKVSKSLMKELLLAVAASVFLGVGTMFLTLSVGMTI